MWPCKDPMYEKGACGDEQSGWSLSYAVRYGKVLTERQASNPNPEKRATKRGSFAELILEVPSRCQRVANVSHSYRPGSSASRSGAVR